MTAQQRIALRKAISVLGEKSREAGREAASPALQHHPDHRENAEARSEEFAEAARVLRELLESVKP